MYEDKMDNPWFQRMALIETLTDEEKIQLYPLEDEMILKCSKIPDVILQRVISKDGSIMEQMYLLRNRFIGDDIIKILDENTVYSDVRERAYKRLYKKEETLRMGLEIIRKLTGN